MSEDKELKQWKEKLFYQPKNGYDRIDAEQTGEIFAYAEGYKQFLNAARTEREAVKEAIRMAEAEGFVRSRLFILQSRRGIVPSSGARH